MNDTTWEEWKKKFKVGDKVLVREKFFGFWDNTWIPEMDKYIGKVFEIYYISYEQVQLEKYGFSFPYQVLVNPIELGEDVEYEEHD